MKKFLVASGICGILLFMMGCNSSSATGPQNSYNPNQPYGYVYDDCGDSIAVNYHFDPSKPGDIKSIVFDSIQVRAVYTNYDGKLSLVTIKVGAVVRGGQWMLSDRVDEGYTTDCFNPPAPKIDVQPVGVTVADGDTAHFAIMASCLRGDDSFDNTISYAWFENGDPLYGQTGPEIDLPAYNSDNNAQITCVVSNSRGIVTSTAAKLKVTPYAPHLDPIQFDLLSGYYVYSS